MGEHPGERLSAYLDGELGLEARRRVEQHLAACAECRDTLEDLRRLVRRARSLDDRPPERDLWTGIAARLDEAPEAEVVPVAGRRRFSFSVPQLAAAAVVLMALSASAAAYLARRAPYRAEEVAARLDAPAPTPAILAEAMRSYDAAISELAAMLEARRPELDSSTVRIVEANLRVIDVAIAQARSALARDPANPYLNRHLQSAYDAKLELLRRVVTLTAAS